MQYAARLEPQPEGGFTVTFPDLPWGVTQGESVEECLALAADVIATVLRDLIRNGETIPQPRVRRGASVYMVDVSSRLPL